MSSTSLYSGINQHQSPDFQGETLDEVEDDESLVKSLISSSSMVKSTSMVKSMISTGLARRIRGMEMPTNVSRLKFLLRDENFFSVRFVWYVA